MAPPLLRPLSLGEVLDVSFGLYRARFVPMLLIAVVCRLLPILLAIYFEVRPPTLLLFLLTSLLSLVLVAIAVAASTFVVSDAYLGRETTAGYALRRAMPFIWTLMGISLLSSLVTFLGAVLLIVPGLILLAGLLLSPVVAVIEGSRSSQAAMSRSWELSKGSKGKILLTILVAFLLLLVPTIALGGFGGIIGAGAGRPVALALIVIPLILQVFVYPFVYVVQTVLYYDLRVRKEGFDLEVLAAAMTPG